MVQTLTFQNDSDTTLSISGGRTISSGQSHTVQKISAEFYKDVLSWASASFPNGDNIYVVISDTVALFGTKKIGVFNFFIPANMHSYLYCVYDGYLYKTYGSGANQVTVKYDNSSCGRSTARFDFTDTAYNLQGIEKEEEARNSSSDRAKINKLNEALNKFRRAENSEYASQTNKNTYKNNQAVMLNKIGDLLHSNGDYTGAIQKYDAAIALNNDKLYHANKANSLIQLGRYQDAITSSQEALRLDGNYNRAKDIKATALNKQGCALEQEGKDETNQAIKQAKYEAARQKFVEAERTTVDQANKNTYKNNQAVMLNKIGDILYNSGDYTGAIQKYDAAIALNNDKVVYHANKANSLIQLGRYQDAITSSQEALRLDGNYNRAKDIKATALNNQGCALSKEGKDETNQAIKQAKYEAARQKFVEAERTTTDQSNKTIYRNNQALMLNKIGDILYNSGDYDGALNKYREAHSTSEVIAVKTACDNGITRAEVEIDARLAEERGDNIVTDGDLKEALAEYRQASERSMIKETKDRCLGKVEDLELMIIIKESEEQFRQEQDIREQTELSIVIIKSIQEFSEELTKKVIEESRKTYSHELYRKGLDHKERGDEEYEAEDEGAAYEEYRKALGKFKEAMKCGKPEGIITALRELREAFSNLDAKEEVSDINRIFDDLVGGVPVITDIQTQNPVDQILGHHAEHNDSV